MFKAELSIDIETYCELALDKVGLYKYVEHPSFDIILISYKYNDKPVQTIDLYDQDLPTQFMNWLTDPTVLKTAHNAAFELACFEKWLSIKLDPSQWQCTMILAAQIGLPLKLAEVCKVLKTDAQKLDTGKKLITYFCQPSKATKTKPSKRKVPGDDPIKWQAFIEYNQADVMTEKEIRNACLWFKQGWREREVWLMDQIVNKRGMQVDLDFVNKAIALNNYYTTNLKLNAIKKTGLDNPASKPQLKNFIFAETGDIVESLSKKAMPDLRKTYKDTAINEILDLSIALGKSSVAKYITALNATTEDGRIKGQIQYYGANRTGRWGGRLVQPHNLPRIKMSDTELDQARKIVKECSPETVCLIYDDIKLVLSDLIRTMFVAKPGHKLIVADLSAIEARITAWLADENWRLKVFDTHGKIYEASAAQMFKVPIEEVSKDLRQRGKVAELALGYQGSVGALMNMGAIEMGIKEEELLPIVRLWRNSNKNIVRLWYNLQNAVIYALTTGPCKIKHGLTFYKEKNSLIIVLPSGRKLVYHNARYSQSMILYEQLNQTTKKWETANTYGGKILENIVQATARDILADDMLLMHEEGFNIVLHVHDEVVIEEDENKIEKSNKRILEIMRREISWAPGLPLNAESFVSDYYKK